MKKLTGKWRVTAINFAVSIEVQECFEEQHYWREACTDDLWVRLKNPDKLRWQYDNR